MRLRPARRRWRPRPDPLRRVLLGYDDKYDDEEDDHVAVVVVDGDDDQVGPLPPRVRPLLTRREVLAWRFSDDDIDGDERIRYERDDEDLDDKERDDERDESLPPRRRGWRPRRCWPPPPQARSRRLRPTGPRGL